MLNLDVIILYLRLKNYYILCNVIIIIILKLIFIAFKISDAYFFLKFKKPKKNQNKK